MSSKTDQTVDLQAERETLQRMLSVEAERKAASKKPLTSKKRAFVNAWVNVALAIGINAETVGYIIDGLRLAEAEPLHEYASKTDAVSAYKGFFEDRRLALNENDCTVILLMSLFALELMSPTSPNPLGFIARRLARCPCKKNGRQMELRVTKLIIRPLANTPISAEADISSESAKELLTFLRHSLEAPQKGNADIAAAKSLLGWLEEHANPTEHSESNSGVPAALEKTPQIEETDEQTLASHTEEQIPSTIDAENNTHESAGGSRKAGASVTMTQTEGTIETTAPAAQPSTNTQTQRSKKPTTQSKAASNGKGKFTRTAKRGELDMDGVIAFLTGYQREHESLDARLEKSRREAREALDQVEKLKAALKSSKLEVEELRSQRSTLSANYADIQRRLEQTAIERDGMREDLAAAEDMLTMLEERNVHEADVADQKMVEELRFEYDQYMDAINAEMSHDLGEIMRDELGRVFDILKSNGINL